MLPSSRREFLKTTGRVAALSSLAGLAIPYVHAAGDETIQVALVGAGGRGTGAAMDAMNVPDGQVKLVAVADVFQDRLDGSVQRLAEHYAAKMDAPKERQFVGFDAYRHAMDCLKPGDIVILATPLAFRAPHFQYAIDKGLNVFMEKPLTSDGPASRRMLELGGAAAQKNLKVAVGLMCRHCAVRHELMERIHDDIGDIILLQGFREHGESATAFSPRKPANVSEVEYQIRRFHSFIWASGGLFNDFYIHNIDECCWAKNAWPVEAEAVGGRHYRGDNVDQNFDNYAVDYTFADGTKLMFTGRVMRGCADKFCSYAFGTKGMAVISSAAHTPAHCKTYKSHRQDKADLIWEYAGKEPNPYQLEWNDLVAAIRADKSYNEIERGVKASVVCNMGRLAAHTGQKVRFEDALNATPEYAPTVAELTLQTPAPVMPDADGRYPVPQPGVVTHADYAVS
ncbi:MAG TPA: Gfo/Idh/MocA family oxidoreductase [Verrucomicrobiae bacterium]|nr:Gfo/Idh/MocA family oxidoreductase [Verrucomicrobiae bacterium]